MGRNVAFNSVEPLGKAVVFVRQGPQLKESPIPPCCTQHLSLLESKGHGNKAQRNVP